MCSDETIRVLIVDDHHVVREGIAAMIGRSPNMSVSGIARNGAEAIESYRAQLPDVTLMDLKMPVMDGVTAITAIRQEYPDARIIVLTTYDGDADIYKALRSGAMGYLLKDGEGEQLLEAIQTVNSNRRCIPPDVAAKLAEYVSGPELTAREIEVLKLIVAGRSNQEIGSDLFITEGTVKGHVNAILNKLGVSDRTQAATAAIKRGLIHID